MSLSTAFTAKEIKYLLVDFFGKLELARLAKQDSAFSQKRYYYGVQVFYEPTYCLTPNNLRSSIEFLEDSSPPRALKRSTVRATQTRVNRKPNKVSFLN